jgi:hypothetical protein
MSGIIPPPSPFPFRPEVMKRTALIYWTIKDLARSSGGAVYVVMASSLTSDYLASPLTDCCEPIFARAQFKEPPVSQSLKSLMLRSLGWFHRRRFMAAHFS